MKRFFFIIITLVFYSQGLFGQLTVEASVKYQRSNNTFSEYYFRELDLFTGVELNKKTNTNEYDSQSDYALIWFGQNQVAIIKLENQIQNTIDRFLGNSIAKMTLDLNCQYSGYVKEGKDQDGTFWKICFYSKSMSSYCY